MRTLPIILTLALSGTATADRIKDMTSIAGVRDNHITGFGIVIGLDGTGDDARSPVVREALAKMLKKLGMTIDPNQMKAKNVAAVMLTTELPAFAKPGMAIDVTVSSMGNAKSLVGGTLLAAPIKGPDQRTWAIAQGALSIGGHSAEGSTGSSEKKNHTLVGRIPGGAIVEAAAPTEVPKHQIALVLDKPDFTTATRMRDAIDATIGPNTARVVDAATVIVPIGKTPPEEVSKLIARLEAIEVEPDMVAKVVIDEKTGTIVIGEQVRLRSAAITFGSLTVEVDEAPEVSQPDAPFSKGTTQVVNRSKLQVKEQNNPIRVMNKAATVGDVAAALGALGAKPRDLVPILRALKAAGALRAEIELL
jgi:flagellar P-ring protein precursor FlgI